jgi:hypothetical protein
MIFKVMLLIILSFNLGCSKILTNLDYSSVQGSDLKWSAQPDINFSSASTYNLSGMCVVELGDVIVDVGQPSFAQYIIPCLLERFNTTVDISSIGLAQGIVTLSASQTFLNANENIEVYLDTIIPLTPTITNPINGSTVSNISQTITGSCEAGLQVTISGDLQSSPLYTICNGSGNYSRNVNLTIAEGSKNIDVFQTDSVGNSSPTTSITINLLYVPSAPIITSPTNGLITNSVSQSININCLSGATVDLTGDFLTSPASNVCAGIGSTTFNVNLTATDGSKSFSATQTNLSGTSAADNISINLDTLDPVAPTITTPANTSNLNNISQSITGNCEAGATLNISGDINGSPVTTTCTIGGTYSQAITLNAGEGIKAISVNQVDSASNTSPATNISVTLDTLRPTVAITSSESSPTSVSPIPVTITFNEPVSGFISTEITVTNGTITNFTGGPSVYNAEITPTAIGDVTVSVAANVAQDAAANLNTSSVLFTINYAMPSGPFISIWDITAGPLSVSLPLGNGSLTYNFNVDWGDSSPPGIVTSNSDPDRNHTYGAPGIYTITITGVLQGWNFSGGQCRITEVVQIGYMDWRDLEAGFRDCPGLVDIGVVDGNEFSTVNNMNLMFRDSPNANPDTTDWNVSNVLTMEGMFINATSANPITLNWNVSSVTTMQEMFSGAISANPNTSTWVTTNLTTAERMFEDATIANPNTSSWDISNITNPSGLNDMFRNAGIDNLNYSNFLIMANSTTVTNNMNLGNVNAQYQPAAVTARNNLVTVRSWTINDLGAE